MTHTPGPWGIADAGHRLWVAPLIKTGGAKIIDRDISATVASYPRIAEFKEPKSGAKRGQNPRWFGFTEETKANARLIAAAPDLLAALINLIERGGHISPLGGEASVAAVRRAGKYMEALDEARAAIAKATGGP